MRVILIRSFIVFFAIFLHAILFSNPAGQEVIAGFCEANKNGNKLQLTTSDRAILHWKDFSIGPEEVTRFIQPNSSSVVLNRVVSANVSQIQGNLQANGHVILVNPKGVLITKSGVVDTASFIASSLDVLDEAFLQNTLLKFSGDSKKGVLNYGTIRAWDGDIVLVGFSSQNHGSVEAKNGDVHIIGSDNVYLKPSRTKRLYIQTKGLDEKKLACEGNPYQVAFNHLPEEDALDVLVKDGQSFLVASSIVTGKITSQKKNGDAMVFLIGDQVVVDNHAKIDVSSKESGGSIYVGGSFQGKNPHVHNSRYTYVGPDVELIARSIENADGGEVILWSDGYTCFKGCIDVRGGSVIGNGGLVEISGIEGFDFTGKTLRSAENGKFGQLLLDPNADIIIHHDNLYAGAFRDKTWVPTDAKSYIEIGNHFTAGTLLFELQQGDVTIQTEGKGFDEQGGNIHLHDDLIYHLLPGHTLTLKTKGDIVLKASLVNVGPGDVIIDSCKNLLLDAENAKQEICLGAHIGKVHIKQVEKDLRVIGGTFYPAILGVSKSVVETKGSILIDDIGNDLILRGGKTKEGFALIGSYEAPSSYGSINIKHIGNNLHLEANKGLCQIGHMQTSAIGNLEGDITIKTVGNDVDIISSSFAKAHIGHGSEGKYIYKQKGNINLENVQGDINVTSKGSPSQIGHANSLGENGDKIGDIFIHTNKDINLASGNTEKGFALIGHGGHGGKFDKTLIKGSISAHAKGDIFLKGADSVLEDQVKNGFAVIGFAFEGAKISSSIDIIAPVFEISSGKDVIIRSGNASDAVIGAHLPLLPNTFTLDVKHLQLHVDKYLFVEGFDSLTKGIYTEAVLGFRPDPEASIDQYQNRLGLLIYGKEGIVVQGGAITEGDHPAFIRGLNKHGTSVITTEGDLAIYAEAHGEAGIIHEGALQLISNEGTIEVFSADGKDAFIEVYGNKLDMYAKEKINLKDPTLPSGKINIKVDEDKSSPSIFHSGNIYREIEGSENTIDTVTIQQTNYKEGENLQVISSSEDLIFMGTYFSESKPLFSLLCNGQPVENYYQDSTIQVTYEANILVSEFLFRITPLMEYLGYKEQFSLSSQEDLNLFMNKKRDFYIRRPYVFIKGLYQDPLYW